MTLRGAVFDMDGTLFDTERIYMEIWFELGREYGVSLGADFTREVCGTGGEKMYRILEQYFSVPDGSVVERKWQERSVERMKYYVPLKEGTLELLEWFRGHGYVMAVASSSPMSWITHYLDVSGTAQYFREVISGRQIARGKPAPDIFLQACERLGVEPADCWVFEDSKNGVKAGYAAGCRTVLIPDLTEPDDETRALCAVYPSFTVFLKELKEGRI
ncbi:MAG: HAD family phosphatase [Solobacterium sp.]|nr:HAD family phosphatase [Solobacterium sp.]